MKVSVKKKRKYIWVFENGLQLPFLGGNEMKTTVFQIKWLVQMVTLCICSWITLSFLVKFS